MCQNELQRKKNEADLLREKVNKLETDIHGMKQDLAKAKEQRLQHRLELETTGKPTASSDSSTPHQKKKEGVEEKEEENSDTVCTQSLQKEVERLKQQLREEKEAQEKLASSFEQERQTWNKEKGRVIKYQKQLQVNYLQMHRKNRDLERILKELTAELESRTELAMDINYSSGLQTYDDVIATEIWLGALPHCESNAEHFTVSFSCNLTKDVGGKLLEITHRLLVFHSGDSIEWTSSSCVS